MKLKSLICGLFVLAAAVACNPEDVVTPELEVGVNSVQITAESASSSFTVKTNQKWTASADVTWVHMNPSSGDPSDSPVKVTITADDNTSSEDRRATITVKAGKLTETVSVTQVGKPEPAPEPEPEPEPEPDPVPDPVLSVDDDTINDISSDGADTSITVTSNNPWTAAVDVEWIVLSKTSGEATDEGGEVIDVTVLQNEGTEARSGVVTFTSGELTATVTVNQNAPEPVEPGPEPTVMPEIPETLIPTAVWEGTFESKFWDSGIMVLSNGYDWTARKAGEYVKITCAPTDSAEEWMVGLRNGDWQATGIFPEFYYMPEGGVVIELTQEVIEYFAANKGLVVQGNNATITRIEIYSTEAIDNGGADEPEIPADYVAVTLWEGSKAVSWGTAMDALANGGYNWGTCKVGQYVKIHYAPTDSSKGWTLQLVYSDPDYQWQTIENYDNKGDLVLELTEELLAKFTSPNKGMIVHGNNITVTKVELYREPAGEAGYALTMTNKTAGANAWDTQVWYTLDAPLVSGKEYVFTCVVKSTVARDWCTVLLQSADGSDQNYNHGMNLFTEWTPTTITFKPDKDTYKKITFNIGDFAGVVSIDNVSMKEAGSDVELIKNGDFEDGSTVGWGSWNGAEGIGEGYVE